MSASRSSASKQLFGVKINRYHSYNGRFSEQPFRTEIKGSNRIITFCGVGSHHQNEISESRIQTLILGDRILLVNEKYIGHRQ